MMRYLTNSARQRMAAAIIALLAAGCATVPKVDKTRPVEYVVSVRADGLWQNSGVYAGRGQLIQVRAEGKWGDRDELVDAEGNPDTYKGHHGVNAPAYALLMRMSTDTNKTYFAGSEADAHALRSGYVMFRSNISLPQRAEGELRVNLRIATDTDGDGVPDYDELYIWGTDALDPDTNGLGFGDLHKIKQMQKALEEEGGMPPLWPTTGE